MRLLSTLAATALISCLAMPAMAASTCRDSSADKDLSGTHWIGLARWDDGDINSIKVTFRPDCTVEYSYDGSTYTNGRWVQRGQLIEWNTNDYYAVYIGNTDGKSVGGVIYNKTHDHGSWVFIPDN